MPQIYGDEYDPDLSQHPTPIVYASLATAPPRPPPEPKKEERSDPRYEEWLAAASVCCGC